MPDSIQKPVVDFYMRGYRHFGNGWRSVGWSSLQTQTTRFQVLCEIGLKPNSKILDLGCGYGDLFPYLAAHHPTIGYMGCDLVPEIVAKAKSKYPEGRFKCCDVLDSLPDYEFDYAMSSGTFNVEFGDNQPKVMAVLAQLFKHCSLGVAMNFLSTRSPKRDRIFHYYDPQEMLKLVREICPESRLREGYLENDFTLFMTK